MGINKYYGDDGTVYNGQELEWTPVDESLETTELCPIKEYILRRQDTRAAQVARRTIYYL